MVARWKADGNPRPIPRPRPPHGDFTATGGEPRGEGVTTVTKDPGNATQAKAVAPKVTMPATVKLNAGKTLGETGQFGHIQNLSSSTRGGTYRKGGDPEGEVVSQHREGRSNRRDATDDTKIPLYWPPTFTLTELFGSADAIGVGVGSAITLEVTHVDSGQEGSATFKLTGTKELAVGSGKYTVSVAVA